MKTKKIFAAALAGLCAVSAMGVSAFAADDTTTVEAAGEKSYKITAGFQAPTMDVTVPTEIKGVINPYKINVVIDGLTFESEGVASPRYAIVNNSSDIGVKVNATYSADGLDGIVATEDAATDPAKNTKGQKLAYVTLNAALGTGADAEATEIMSTTEKTTAAPILELTENGGANNAGEIWLGGAVPETPADKWTTKDKLTINVVLDLVPYNTGAGGSTPAPTGPVFANASDVTMTASGGSPTTTLTDDATSSAFVFDPAKTTYNLTSNMDTTGGRVDLTVGTVTDATATIAATGVVSYNTGNGRITASSTGTGTVTITLEDDNDSTKTTVYTFNFTIT